MSEIIPFDRNTLPMAAGQAAVNNDLTEGVTGTFPIVSFRGKIFRIKAKGVEHLVTNPDGDPSAAIRVVILKANPKYSKIYYDKPYEEGSDEPPVCFSIGGFHPDPGAQTKQANLCETCPRNVWGSKITPQGTKTKECQDSRRMVVVPTGDMRNERMGGGMLFRVPPSSLTGLGEYATKLTAAGASYFEVSTKISFDLTASHAKPIFGFDRQLTVEERDLAIELLNADSCNRILQEASDHTAPVPAPVGVAPNGTPAQAPASVPPQVPEAVPAAVVPSVVVVDPVVAPVAVAPAVAPAPVAAVPVAPAPAPVAVAPAPAPVAIPPAPVAPPPVAPPAAVAPAPAPTPPAPPPAPKQPVDVDSVVNSLLG